MTDLVMDLVFVIILVAFFALSSGLIRFCAKLMDQGRRG
jgi:hypothetical protein